MDDIQVVECWDGRVFLGMLEQNDPPWIIIRSGYPGRPAVLHRDEVSDVIDADEHPDVTVL